MRSILLDADAVLCLRKLGLLSRICASAARQEPIVVTEFVARHELRDIAADVSALEAQQCLRVVPIEIRSEAGRRWSELRQEGVDKGEAEALAWALGFRSAERPVFVARDRGALQVAKDRHVPHSDVFGLVVALVHGGYFTEAEARTALGVWNDRRHELCRPRDWDSFDVTFKRRSAAVLDAFDIASTA